MAEFLLEIFSEEIPARMQKKAGEDLRGLINSRMDKAYIEPGSHKFYTTPRRLTLLIEDVPSTQIDLREERRGPRVDAPEKAIQGFRRSVEELAKDVGATQIVFEEREDKKGTFLYAIINQKGRPTKDVIGEFMPEIIRNFPWPKSQRWGAGSLRWVRPMHSILCILDGKVVDFEVDGIKSGNVTYGHRFMAPEKIEVSDFATYKSALEKAYVVLDRDQRKKLIKKEAEDLAAKENLAFDDEALLNEVAGLAEYPVVMMGEFDEEFLDVPPEALTSAMRTHQKYFSLKDNEGNLSNKFIFVSNMKTDDNGAKIIDGNERVLRARLSDTKFFWDQDLKSKLEDHLPALNDIVFHAKLGTVGDRVKRLEKLAGYIASLVGADVEKSKLAAKLSKSDLVTGMVDECPELQGLMGKYFALAEGQDAEVADAIADHYSPKGPSDKCPSAPVSIAVALADKIDTLFGFFDIDEKPSGSKDPFALRRAALGVIRLVLENQVRINLDEVFEYSDELRESTYKQITTYSEDYVRVTIRNALTNEHSVIRDLRQFFWDRLKVYAKDQGIRHDIIGAEFTWDFVRLMSKANALQKFIAGEDGENLLAGYKRAANILRAEEKKDKREYTGIVKVDLLNMKQEEALFNALSTATENSAKAIEDEAYEDAMAHLSNLRQPIDEFFEDVTVNSEEQEVRVNRLELLSKIRQTMNLVVDFYRIEG